MRATKSVLGPKFWLWLALAAATSGFADDAVPLRIRADSWMPFNGDPTSSQPGYVVDILREIFEPQGIKVDYQIMPWAAALKAAETGEIDGVIGADKSEAANLIRGSEPIAEPQFALFVRKDSTWKYDSVHSLKGIRVGAIEGYSYWNSLDDYFRKSAPPALKLYTGDTPLAEAMSDLAAGRIDALPESVLVFIWAAKSSGRKFSDFRMVYTEAAEPIFVAFGKTDRGKKNARLFDIGLRKMKESGRFDAILGAYGIVNH